MKLYKNKKILVTAGPTWVAIDRVRVLTSIFSGQTGLRLARYFSNFGAEVTLLMGPGRAKFTAEDWQTMTVRQFFYYDELAQLLDEEVSGGNYDIIIHSSAVSDYKIANKAADKIPSGRNDLQLQLTPTEKLVDKVRKDAPGAFLVKFKLQVGVTEEKLWEIAGQSLKATGADLIIANDFEYMTTESHVAFIIDCKGKKVVVRTKDEMCEKLACEIAARLQD